MPMRCSESAFWWINGSAHSLAQTAPGKDRIRGSAIARLRATRLGREEEW